MVDQPYLAADGLPARKSQEYAREKLHLAGAYMDIFATGMKYTFDRRVYLDLLAGPGICRLKDSATEFDGSPRLSLLHPFTHRVFVEGDPALAAALGTRCPPPSVVIAGDCNDPAVIQRLRDHVPPGKTLGLAFVDNLGLDVPLSTLKALTANKRIDLMIVVQVQDLTRNVRDVFNGIDDRARFDAFFGGQEWQTVAHDCYAANLSDSDTASALLDLYRQALTDIGYPYVDEANRPMKNSRNAPQYRLVLAGKHPKAVEFFRKVQKIDPRGQRSLPW